VYDLVWESEFKNIINVGKIWLKFIEEVKAPFGIPLRKKGVTTKLLPETLYKFLMIFMLFMKLELGK
jgi:hypothetical protein